MIDASDQPPAPAVPVQGRRTRLRPVAVAVQLALLACALGLLARAVPSANHARAHQAGARAARNYPPSAQPAARPATLLEILAEPDIIPTHDHPLLGRQAPDFELVDLEGKFRSRGELLDGGPVVLIFYFGSDCVSCVRQLREINADLPLFRELGARVIAISADPAELTRQRLPLVGALGFPVLSDPGNQVAQAYGVLKRAEDGKMADLRCLCGRWRSHGTFVIDRKGIVEWANTGDMPLRRDRALLYQLAKLAGRLP